MDTAMHENGTSTIDENIVGDLEPIEIKTLNTLREAAREVTLEIGNLEVRKARLLGSLSDIEGRAQQILNGVSKRLGIPDGQAWQVTPEGKARVLKAGSA